MFEEIPQQGMVPRDAWGIPHHNGHCMHHYRWHNSNLRHLQYLELLGAKDMIRFDKILDMESYHENFPITFNHCMGTLNFLEGFNQDRRRKKDLSCFPPCWYWYSIGKLHTFSSMTRIIRK
jgi:hypothetical protein